tara:strand:+ start:732 stop:956 length:225 start_codon:yes stop_codon:yes gene_type:complete
MKPKKPDVENIKYKIKPTTTGGKLINEFEMITITFFPIKLLVAIWLANITDRTDENMVAIIEIYSESKIISIKL